MTFGLFCKARTSFCDNATWAALIEFKYPLSWTLVPSWATATAVGATLNRTITSRDVVGLITGALGAVALAAEVPDHVGRVGVFVDPDEDFIARAITAGRLTAIQLHGREDP